MSPYYAAPDRPAGVIWRPTGGCHLPGCMRAWLGVGTYSFLCLEHALVAAGVEPAPSLATAAPVDDGAIRKAFRERLRVPSEVPGVARIEDPEEPGRIDAIRAVMLGLGAQPFWTVPTDWPERPYGEAVPGRALRVPDEPSGPPRAATVAPDDERVPRTARGLAKAASEGSWGVLLRVTSRALDLGSGEELAASCVLRARRGRLRAVASWHDGKFVGAWTWAGRGLPAKVGARELGTILRGQDA